MLAHVTKLGHEDVPDTLLWIAGRRITVTPDRTSPINLNASYSDLGTPHAFTSCYSLLRLRNSRLICLIACAYCTM